MREQTHTIKPFLPNNSVFKWLNQRCIFLVTLFVLFSQEGSNDKQITAQKHASSGRQFQSHWQKHSIYHKHPTFTMSPIRMKRNNSIATDGKKNRLVGEFDFWRQWFAMWSFSPLPSLYSPHTQFFFFFFLLFLFYFLRTEQFALKYDSNTSLLQNLLKKKEKRKKKSWRMGKSFSIRLGPS